MRSAPLRPRVVIDANLVLSAFIFAQGRLVNLRLAWQTQSLSAPLSPPNDS